MDFIFYNDQNNDMRLLDSRGLMNSVCIKDIFVTLLNSNFSLFAKNVINLESKIDSGTYNDLDFGEIFRDICDTNLPYPINEIYKYHLFLYSDQMGINDGIKKIIEEFFEERDIVDLLKERYFLLKEDFYDKIQIISYEVKIEYHNNNFRQIIYISSMHILFGFCLFQIMNNKIHVNKCNNCKKFFIPTNRSDEIYCNNIFKGNKTCKQVGYEEKTKNDPIKAAYRAEYKNRNAKKRRNEKNKVHAVEDFRKWNDSAQNLMDKANNGTLSIEEFIKSLKSI